MTVPYSFCFFLKISAISVIVFSLYTTPVGLLGVLTITTLVLGVIDFSKAARSGWKVSVSGGITTSSASTLAA